jgi:hypothetical protein
MSGANEAELAALENERHDLYNQLVGMTKEYVTAIMPRPAGSQTHRCGPTGTAAGRAGQSRTDQRAAVPAVPVDGDGDRTAAPAAATPTWRRPC